MRPPERKSPGGNRGSDLHFGGVDRNHSYREMPKGARKAACALRPEAGRRWHP